MTRSDYLHESTLNCCSVFINIIIISLVFRHNMQRITSDVERKDESPTSRSDLQPNNDCEWKNQQGRDTFDECQGALSERRLEISY